MASGNLLRQLIKTGTEGDPDAFRRVSENVIREERDKKHHLLANDLEQILYGRANTLSFNSVQLTDRLPRDKERNLPLMEMVEPVRSLDDIVLSDVNSSIINEILEEHHRSEVLKSYGLKASDRILFCGPPGCGKTLSAEVIASELGLPLGVVRIDSVISSYLGETAANLRMVFDFISKHPIIVLFDEFDAIGKERSDSADHGELKRVVNAFLQMLDSYQGGSILIAATNHEKILDSAVWRRFDEILFFEPPNSTQLKNLLTVKLRGVRREFELEDLTISGLFKGMSYADVERVLRRAIKEMVLSGGEFLQERNLRSAISKEDARNQRSARSLNSDG